ncbi:MAG: hypothetical protein P1V20_02960 [Verrucomicrobiales bacterium]|nr:hypothetical protein [Verrucomicrobiales bacterium]
MASPAKYVEESQKISLHHSPPGWFTSQQPPIDSLSQVTRQKREEWSRFFFENRRPGIAAFCGPDIWIPWYFANPNFSPRIFELRNSNNQLEAVLPLCCITNRLTLTCETEFSFQELVAVSVSAGVDLLQEVLYYCRLNDYNLSLGKVAPHTLLFDAVQLCQAPGKSNLFGRVLGGGEIEHFTTDKTGLTELGQRYPYSTGVGTLRHFSGHQISEQLIAAIAETAKSTPGIFTDQNFIHFLTLQARNSGQLQISVKRNGGEITSFLIGYFENGGYHPVYQHEEQGSNDHFLHEVLHDLYHQTVADEFLVYHPAGIRFDFSHYCCNKSAFSDCGLMSAARKLGRHFPTFRR